VAKPSAFVVGGLAGRGGGLLQQVMLDSQWRSLAGLAVGAVGEGPTAELDEMLIAGGAVKDLEQEEVYDGDRVKETLAAVVVLLSTSVADGVRRQMGGLVLSQAFQNGQDARWLPSAPSGCRARSFPTTTVPEIFPVLESRQIVHQSYFVRYLLAAQEDPFSFTPCIERSVSTRWLTSS
jgi:hypothetical protein